MTDVEAKEVLISLIDYAAYHETPHSLWPSDKNRLFESDHYPEDRPVYSPSVWGEGDEFERQMAELLRWGTSLGSKADWLMAIRTLATGNHYLNRIVERAGLANV